MIRRLIALSFLVVSGAAAQSYNYPALQTPRIVDREYNFAAASGAGTSLYFQWREGASETLQWGVDAGLVAPKGGGDTRLIFGGSVAYQVNRATDDLPFDIALTGGIGASFANGNSVSRIPLGAVIGHSFLLDGGYRLTPYAHPRLSLDHCGSCAGTNSKVDVDVDLGVDFVMTPQISFRAAVLLGGTDYFGGNSSVGFSLAWTPKGLKK